MGTNARRPMNCVTIAMIFPMFDMNIIYIFINLQINLDLTYNMLSTIDETDWKNGFEGCMK